MPDPACLSPSVCLLVWVVLRIHDLCYQCRKGLFSNGDGQQMIAPSKALLFLASLALAPVQVSLLAGCSDGKKQAHATDAGTEAGIDSGKDADPDSGADAAVEAPLLLVDTDMGLDDARVIVSLPMQALYQVIGIVTVEGAARAAKGADNVLRLLAALGVDTVPVAVGSSTTITGEDIPAPVWRDMAEGLGGLSLDPAVRTVEPEEGVAFERRLLRESPKKVSVLAIGPATNLARALAEEPSLADRIEAIHLLGDFSSCTGYNCTTDADAGAQVLASGVSVYLLMPAQTDLMPFDLDLLASVEALTGPASLLIAWFMAGHANGAMKLWDDGLLASILDGSVIGYSILAGAIRSSDTVDVQGVEALLLDLWDTQSPVMPPRSKEGF